MKVADYVIVRWLRQRAWGIGVSLIVAGIVAAPPLVWRFSSNFEGLPFLKTNTEEHYVAQVQEIYNGHYGLGNPFLGGVSKHEPYLFPPLSPYVIAGFGKLFGLGVIQAVELFRILIVFGLSFLIYITVGKITGNTAAALLSPLAVILGYHLVDPRYVLDLMRGVHRSEFTFIDYGRPVNPQVSSFFFFAYVYALWSMLVASGRHVRMRYGLVAAIVLGLSFYVYLFTWTYAIALSGILLLLSIGQKEYVRAKAIAAVVSGAIVIGMPYLWHVRVVNTHIWFQEVSERFGFVHSRDLNVSLLVVGTLIIFGLVWRWLNSSHRLFFGSVFATALGMANEQVITGQYVFNHHYHWYYTTPLLIIFLTLLVSQALEKISKKKWIYKSLVAVIATVLVMHGTWVQVVSYEKAVPLVQAEGRYQPFLEWVSRQPEEKTFLTSNPLSGYLVALTPANVYYYGTSIYTLVPDTELLKKYIVYEYLKGVQGKAVVEKITQAPQEVLGFTYGYRYYFQSNVCSNCLPEHGLNTVRSLVPQLNTDQDVLNHLSGQVDYLVWDKRHNPEWIVSRLKLPIVVEFPEIIVYEVPTVSLQ